MTIVKDLERLCNESLDALDSIRENLLEMKELHDGVSTIIDENASKFVAVNTVLEDILSEIESIDQ